MHKSVPLYIIYILYFVRYRSSEKKKGNPFVTPARKSSSTFKDVPNNPNNSCTRTITPKGARTPETLASTCTTPRNLEDEENKEYERLLQNRNAYDIRYFFYRTFLLSIRYA